MTATQEQLRAKQNTGASAALADELANWVKSQLKIRHDYLEEVVRQALAGTLTMPPETLKAFQEELATANGRKWSPGYAIKSYQISQGGPNLGDFMNVLERQTALKYISESERANLSPGQFAGPGRTYPIRPGRAEDVMHAAYLVGHAADPSVVKANIIRIAHQGGMAHALPDGWEAEEDPSGAQQGKSIKAYGGGFSGYGGASLEAARERYWEQFTKTGIVPEEALKAMKAAPYGSDYPTGFGFSVMPERLMTAYTVRVEQVCFFRRLCAIMHEKTAESLGVLALITEPADFTFTVELAVGTEEVTMTTEKREMNPYPMRSWFRMSKKLLRQAGDVEALRRMGEHRARTEEKQFLIGSGAQSPLGVFTASAYGISTTRDVSTATTAVIVADDLLNLMSTLPAYALTAPTAGWVMHRSVFWNSIRSLTDQAGQYLYIPSDQADTELHCFGRLLGLPLYIAEDAPTAITSGSYIAVVGDFGRYGIADRGDPIIEELVELYALTDQVALLLWQEVDGMPLDQGAFARLKVK